MNEVVNEELIHHDKTKISHEECDDPEDILDIITRYIECVSNNVYTTFASLYRIRMDIAKLPRDVKNIYSEQIINLKEVTKSYPNYRFRDENSSGGGPTHEEKRLYLDALQNFYYPQYKRSYKVIASFEKLHEDNPFGFVSSPSAGVQELLSKTRPGPSEPYGFQSYDHEEKDKLDEDDLFIKQYDLMVNILLDSEPDDMGKQVNDMMSILHAVMLMSNTIQVARKAVYKKIVKLLSNFDWVPQIELEQESYFIMTPNKEQLISTLIDLRKTLCKTKISLCGHKGPVMSHNHNIISGSSPISDDKTKESKYKEFDQKEFTQLAHSGIPHEETSREVWYQYFHPSDDLFMNQYKLMVDKIMNDNDEDIDSNVEKMMYQLNLLRNEDTVFSDHYAKTYGLIKTSLVQLGWVKDYDKDSSYFKGIKPTKKELSEALHPERLKEFDLPSISHHLEFDVDLKPLKTTSEYRLSKVNQHYVCHDDDAFIKHVNSKIHHQSKTTTTTSSTCTTSTTTTTSATDYTQTKSQSILASEVQQIQDSWNKVKPHVNASQSKDTRLNSDDIFIEEFDDMISLIVGGSSSDINKNVHEKMQVMKLYTEDNSDEALTEKRLFIYSQIVQALVLSSWVAPIIDKKDGTIIAYNGFKSEPNKEKLCHSLMTIRDLNVNNVH